MCSSHCSGEPNSSSAGPIIDSPIPASGARARMRRISSARICASSLVRPPPPYSVGHISAVHPRSAMRSIHSRVSGLRYFTLRPPTGYSPSTMGVRMLGGQLSSSQARVSSLKLM